MLALLFSVSFFWDITLIRRKAKKKHQKQTKRTKTYRVVLRGDLSAINLQLHSWQLWERGDGNMQRFLLEVYSCLFPLNVFVLDFLLCVVSECREMA